GARCFTAARLPAAARRGTRRSHPANSRHALSPLVPENRRGLNLPSRDEPVSPVAARSEASTDTWGRPPRASRAASGGRPRPRLSSAWRCTSLDFGGFAHRKLAPFGASRGFLDVGIDASGF